MTEFYQSTPLPLPTHKVSGMTMSGQRRIYYDPKAGKIIEYLQGKIEGHRMPMMFPVDSKSFMDVEMVRELISELERALHEHSFARAS